MIRRAAAVVFMLTIYPALVHAQDAVLTITESSAEVHTGPTTVTPVIGHVAQGTALPVLRNLGSWVRIAWPDAPEGVAYVHVTMGKLGTPTGTAAVAPNAQAAVAPSSAIPPAPVAERTRRAVPAPTVVGVRDRDGVERLGHVFALGGLVGSTRSFGAAARAWHRNRLGVQVALTRDVQTSNLVADHLTVTQIEPAVLYALFDRVSDSVWVRPYVGSGVSVRRQTLGGVSDSGTGFRFFAGSELTLAAAPQIALSADAGYRRLPTPLPGFDASTFDVSIAAHWYFK